VKAITRALGNARDTDVQLAFLAAYEEANPEDTGGEGGTGVIRKILQDQRRQQQETILTALMELEKDGTLHAIGTAISDILHGVRKTDGDGGYSPDVYELSALRVQETLDAFFSSGAAAYSPDDVEGHHRMRIAAKKLRYMIEVFRPLYADKLRPAIGALKRLQEILGELHDCDVWVGLLSGRAAAGAGPVPETRNGDSPGGSEPMPRQTGLSALLLDRKAHRRDLYGQLVSEWEACRSVQVFDKVRDIVISGNAQDQKKVPAPADPCRGQVAEDGPGPLAGTWPGGQGHAKQVTRLALMLFDELSILHGYGTDERSLLERAGLFHDIGWAYGQKGHHTTSFRLILADRTLPVTPRERTIIALVARYHRKALPEEKDRDFSALKRKDRKRVRALAALLRIADGLDYSHGNQVAALHCTVGDDTVTCAPEYRGDGRIERARAIRKSDLFGEVYGRRLVIL